MTNQAEIAEANYRKAEARADAMAPIYDRRKAAQEELTALLVEHLGKDIGQAIALLNQSGPYFDLEKALKGVRKQANAEKKAAKAAKATTSA